MDIRIQRTMTGREHRDAILAGYGDREAVEDRARAGDADAQDALWNLDLYDEDPTRLDDEVRIEDLLVLDRNDLSRLTETRLHILDVLRELGEADVKTLTEALRRDAKNVSRDVACLEEFGLIKAHRRGKRKWLHAAGNQITITV